MCEGGIEETMCERGMERGKRRGSCLGEGCRGCVRRGKWRKSCLRVGV